MGNMVRGNWVTVLNDEGFHFKVFPPEIHMDETGLAGSADKEALVICIGTSCGNVHLNIALRYLHRRRQEREEGSTPDCKFRPESSPKWGRGSAVRTEVG